MQIATRFVGIAKAFHYTVEQLYDLDYEMWVILAVAFDDYAEENRRVRDRLRRR